MINKIIIQNKDNSYTVDWNYVFSMPEFSILKTINQSPIWHKEGVVANHIQNVTNVALNMINNGNLREQYSERQKYILILSCLFHDIGKGVSTFQGKDGRWHSYGHEDTGEKITRKILWNEPYEIREKVCKLVKLHMKPLMIFDNKHFAEELFKLMFQFSDENIDYMFDLLIKLKICDLRGSVFEDFDRYREDTKKLMMLDIFSNVRKNNDALTTFSKLKFLLKKDFLREEKELNVEILFGLPGAGKDTYIINNFKNKDNVVVLCRDDIRTELGYCKPGEKIVGTNEQEEKVNEIFNERLINAVKSHKYVIINNLNLKKKYRDSIKETLKDYNCSFKYTYIGANSLSKNIERRKGQISEDMFEKMILSIDWPTVDEYNDFSYELNF